MSVAPEREEGADRLLRSTSIVSSMTVLSRIRRRTSFAMFWSERHGGATSI